MLKFVVPLLTLLCSCASPQPPPVAPVFAISKLTTTDGSPAVLLSRTVRDPHKPQIVEVTVLPSRGMAIDQIRANIPGLGVVSLLESGSDGGVILIPFANRIRGSFDSDKNEWRPPSTGRLSPSRQMRGANLRRTNRLRRMACFFIAISRHLLTRRTNRQP